MLAPKLAPWYDPEEWENNYVTEQFIVVLGETQATDVYVYAFSYEYGHTFKTETDEGSSVFALLSA